MVPTVSPIFNFCHDLRLEKNSDVGRAFGGGYRAGDAVGVYTNSTCGEVTLWSKKSYSGDSFDFEYVVDKDSNVRVSPKVIGIAAIPAKKHFTVEQRGNSVVLY